MRLSKQESRKRFSELNALLYEWDPIGVGPDLPRDEYECLAGPLIRMLESGATHAEIVAYLQNELVEHFGLEPNKDDIETVATRVRAWFYRGWKDRMAE